MALIEQSDLEARLGRSLTNEEQTAFTLINAANQAYVEKLIGTKLESVSETTRHYDGGLLNLPIDPCTSVSSVKRVDEDFSVEDTYDTSDYIAEPYNSTLKTMIRHRYGKFVRGFRNIAVTAKFSIFEDTDTLNMVKDILLDVLEGQVTDSKNKKKESIEGYSVEYADTDTKTALNKLGSLFQQVI